MISHLARLTSHSSKYRKVERENECTAAAACLACLAVSPPRPLREGWGVGGGWGGGDSEGLLAVKEEREKTQAGRAVGSCRLRGGRDFGFCSRWGKTEWVEEHDGTRVV